MSQPFDFHYLANLAEQNWRKAYGPKLPEITIDTNLVEQPLLGDQEQILSQFSCEYYYRGQRLDKIMLEKLLHNFSAQGIRPYFRPSKQTCSKLMQLAQDLNQQQVSGQILTTPTPRLNRKPDPQPDPQNDFAGFKDFWEDGKKFNEVLEKVPQLLKHDTSPAAYSKYKLPSGYLGNRALKRLQLTHACDNEMLDMVGKISARFDKTANKFIIFSAAADDYQKNKNIITAALSAGKEYSNPWIKNAAEISSALYSSDGVYSALKNLGSVAIKSSKTVVSDSVSNYFVLSSTSLFGPVSLIPAVATKIFIITPGIENAFDCLVDKISSNWRSEPRANLDANYQRNLRSPLTEDNIQELLALHADNSQLPLVENATALMHAPNTSEIIFASVPEAPSLPPSPQEIPEPAMIGSVMPDLSLNLSPSDPNFSQFVWGAPEETNGRFYYENNELGYQREIFGINTSISTNPWHSVFNLFLWSAKKIRERRLPENIKAERVLMQACQDYLEQPDSPKVNAKLNSALAHSIELNQKISDREADIALKRAELIGFAKKNKDLEGLTALIFNLPDGIEKLISDYFADKTKVVGFISEPTPHPIVFNKLESVAQPQAEPDQPIITQTDNAEQLELANLRRQQLLSYQDDQQTYLRLTQSLSFAQIFLKFRLQNSNLQAKEIKFLKLISSGTALALQLGLPAWLSQRRPNFLPSIKLSNYGMAATLAQQTLNLFAEHFSDNSNPQLQKISTFA